MQTMAPWLVRARVTPPERMPDLVRREVLLERLAGQQPLVSVLAPAGFGKTSLLTQWREDLMAQEARVAWFSVDETDDPATAVAYLALAFHEAGLELGEWSSIEHTMHDAGLANALGYLLRSVERSAQPWVLMLDDIESASAELLQRVLRPITGMRPANLRLCFTGREDPGLSLSKFDVRGELCSVSHADLRMSRNEVARMSDGALSARALERLYTYTSGWPAALQLLGDTARSSPEWPIGDRTAPRHDIADYLREQFLERLPEAQRQFLSDISILRDVSSQQAEVMTGCDEAPALMQRLHERMGGLFVPVDRLPDTYRLHALLRDFLRFEFSRTDVARYRLVHARAAEFEARQGRWLDGMRHAVAAQQPQRAAEIFEANGGVRIWVSEGMLRLHSALDLLEKHVLAEHPRIQLARCLALAKRGQVLEATTLFERTQQASDGLTRDHADGDDTAVMVEGYVVSLLLSEYGCRPSGITQQDTRWRQVLAETDREPLLQSFLLTWQCLFNFQTGRLSEGFEFGRQAMEHMRRRNFRYGELFIHVHYGTAEVARGRLAAALQEYQQANRIIRADFAADQELRQVADIVLAEVYWESGDTASASRYVRRLSRRVRFPEAWFDLYMAAHLTVIESLDAQRGAGAATSYAQEALDLASSEGLERLQDYLHGVCFLLLTGRQKHAEARAYALRYLPPARLDLHQPDLTWRERELRSRVRCHLALLNSEHQEALREGESLTAYGLEFEMPRLVMHGLVSQAEALLADRAFVSADHCLDAALALASDDGYVRPLLRASAHVRARLPELVAQRGEVGADWVACLLPESDGHASVVLQAFSPREQEIMVHLADGLPDKLIARGVGLSAHGVRYHLKRIYAKLGVKNRTEAVARAREYGVLAVDSTPGY